MRKIRSVPSGFNPRLSEAMSRYSSKNGSTRSRTIARTFGMAAINSASEPTSKSTRFSRPSSKTQKLQLCDGRQGHRMIFLRRPREPVGNILDGLKARTERERKTEDGVVIDEGQSKFLPTAIDFSDKRLRRLLEAKSGSADDRGLTVSTIMRRTSVLSHRAMLTPPANVVPFERPRRRARRLPTFHSSKVYRSAAVSSSVKNPCKPSAPLRGFGVVA